jgi:hypothetical protein
MVGHIAPVDPRKFHTAELERLHAILAGVSFGGIMELSGGAPKESKDIQLAVALFAVSLVVNLTLYIRYYYLFPFSVRYFGSHYTQFDAMAYTFAAIGPLGGIGAVLHYYSRWTCYGYWTLIVACVFGCSYVVQRPMTIRDKLHHFLPHVLMLLMVAITSWHRSPAMENMLIGSMYSYVGIVTSAYLVGKPIVNESGKRDE